jgi:hypothetical protein
MSSRIKFALAGLLSLSAVTAAFAQSAAPPSLPFHSVWGRLGAQAGDTGPGQAIPFAALSAQLFGGPQSANTIFAGPASGPVASAGFRALIGADLPVPSASTSGGVQSLTCATSNWFNTLSTSATSAGISISIASPAVITLANSFVAGQHVVFSTTGSLPSGLTAGTTYYVIPAGLSSSSFEVSATAGGLAVNTSGAQSGTHSLLAIGGVFGCTQPNFTDLAGSIAGGQIPTGTITSTMILDGTILNADINSAAAIALTKLATVAANTIVGSTAGGTPAALNGAQAGSVLCLPNRQVFTTGTNATYTTPTCNSALPTRIEWEMVGGGGGGAGSGTTPGAAGAGGNTCVNTSSPACTTPLFAANGGALGGTAVTNAAGGAAAGCDLGLTGGTGQNGTSVASQWGGAGGVSFFGGNGFGGAPGSTAGQAAQANTGSGGGGGGDGTTVNSGGGGGAGGYCRKLITSPASSYFYTVAAAGSAGGAGTSGVVGGAGAAGNIVATAYWQ